MSLVLALSALGAIRLQAVVIRLWLTALKVTRKRKRMLPCIIRRPKLAVFIYTRGRIKRLDELGQTFFIRLVIHVQCKDGLKTHFISD